VLGVQYWKGAVRNRNPEQALVWLKRAVESAAKERKIPIGIYHSISSIHEELNDQAEALAWTIRTVEFGSFDGLFAIVDAFTSGKWLPKSDADAYRFFRLAADHSVRTEIAEPKAASLASRMSPPEFASACSLYRELERQFSSAAH